MKRIISIASLFILLSTTITFALTDVGDFMTIDLQGYGWTPITRDNISGNSDLQELGISESDMEKYMDDIDVDALGLYEDIELDIRITDTETEINNLANYTDEEIEEYLQNEGDAEISDVAEKYGIDKDAIDVSLFKGKFNPYILYQMKMDNNYVYQFSTYVNHKKISIVARAERELDYGDMLRVKKTVDSAQYVIDPEYEKEPFLATLGGINIALVCGIIGVIIAGAVFFIIRSKKKSNESATNISSGNTNESKQDETATKQNDIINEESLRSLKELYDAGVLTEEEFAKKKKQILGI